jgi:hypothetical protein
LFVRSIRAGDMLGGVAIIGGIGLRRRAVAVCSDAGPEPGPPMYPPLQATIANIAAEIIRWRLRCREFAASTENRELERSSADRFRKVSPGCELRAFCFGTGYSQLGTSTVLT